MRFGLRVQGLKVWDWLRVYDFALGSRIDWKLFFVSGLVLSIPD